MRGADHAWLPDGAFRPIGTRRTLIRGSGPLVDTVHGEVARACERFGGSVTRDPGPCDLVLELNGEDGSEGFAYGRRDGSTTVTASGARGLLYGLFHVVRLGEAAFLEESRPVRHEPRLALRMLDHWDNVTVHPVMGQVERGYSRRVAVLGGRAGARRPGAGAGVRQTARGLRDQRRGRQQRQRARGRGATADRSAR